MRLRVWNVSSHSSWLEGLHYRYNWEQDKAKTLTSCDGNFSQLHPVYDVTPTDIQEYIKARLQELKREG